MQIGSLSFMSGPLKVHVLHWMCLFLVLGPSTGLHGPIWLSYPHLERDSVEYWSYARAASRAFHHITFSSLHGMLNVGKKITSFTVWLEITRCIF
jgi:hypothetical protein